MANKAISELDTYATSLNDEDLILVSKTENGGSSFTSAKMKGSVLKSEIISMSTILSTIYPNGSVYIDASDSSTCPIASLISGSTWEKIGTSIITGVNGTVSFTSKGTGTIPVKGNRKTVGLLSIRNGEDETWGLCYNASSGNGLVGDHSLYGADVGTSIQVTIGTAVSYWYY